MLDRELEALRRKRLQELRRQIEKKTKTVEKEKAENPREILNRFFVGRAWEVLNAAKAQYPQVAKQIERMLVRLIVEGKIRNKITGEELYGLFRKG